MFNLKPAVMIILGVLMMVLSGIIVPLLMVIHIITPDFLLIFVNYAISVAGLYLGLIGVTQYAHTRRARRKDE